MPADPDRRVSAWMQTPPALAVALLLTNGACGAAGNEGPPAGEAGETTTGGGDPSDGPGGSTTSSDTGTSGSSGTGDSTTGAAGTVGSSGGMSSGPKFDVAPGPDIFVDGSGCTKVDFLFVIDSSGSMGDEQDALIASFPGFIQTIQAALDGAGDYHILVTDTDDTWGGLCETLCPHFDGVCPDLEEYPCADGPPSVCDKTLGAGINYPMGEGATNQLCPFQEGRRFMTEDEPDLSSAFGCAAKVGTDGAPGEMVIGALLAGVGPELNAAGGCNEGFLRDDAILVVTVITDEDDIASGGFPAEWYAELVEAKSGDASALVMLGLIRDTDAAVPVCDVAGEDPWRLRQFIDMFPNSIRGSVCAPSYDGFFQDAVSLIDTTCTDFVPPG